MNRRAFIVSTAAALPMFGSGCAFFDDDSKPQFEYPNGYKDFFAACRNSAIAGIAKIDGKTPALKMRCRYETHKGERKLGGMWCWFSPEWNFYVAGLTYLTSPLRVVIGCSPASGAELHSGVAQHECGHQVLWDAHRDGSHNPRYRSALWGWSGVDAPRMRIGAGMADDGMVLVDGFEREAVE